jgi:uncharacterized repeat protein (TIGR03803 family)
MFTRKLVGKFYGPIIVFCLAIASEAQTFTTLVSFNGTDGQSPYFESLVQGPNGNLYGTTLSGGADGYGTVIEVTPAGKLTTYSPCSVANCPNGLMFGGLALGANGNFYGTTNFGGSNGGGTVFEISATGTVTTLYNFCSQTNCTDGGYPYAGLVQGKDGNFYGTTSSGGSAQSGTVFKVTPTGTFTVLHSFCSKADCTDGAMVYGALIQASDGNFYGTTAFGGADNFGTVFKVSSEGKLTTLHTFKYTDGANPTAGLVQANDGKFYGVANSGGNTNSGTFFKITEAGAFTTLYNFCSKQYCTDGSLPCATLMQGSNGNLYGTTSLGGADYLGSVFEITTAGGLTTLHSFKGKDGKFPYGGLVQTSNGDLYGVTYEGGSSGGVFGYGTVFKLTLPSTDEAESTH